MSSRYGYSFVKQELLPPADVRIPKDNAVREYLSKLIYSERISPIPTTSSDDLDIHETNLEKRDCVDSKPNHENYTITELKPVVDTNFAQTYDIERSLQINSASTIVTHFSTNNLEGRSSQQQHEFNANGLGHPELYESKKNTVRSLDSNQTSTENVFEDSSTPLHNFLTNLTDRDQGSARPKIPRGSKKSKKRNRTKSRIKQNEVKWLPLRQEQGAIYLTGIKLPKVEENTKLVGIETSSNNYKYDANTKKLCFYCGGDYEDGCLDKNCRGKNKFKIVGMDGCNTTNELCGSVAGGCIRFITTTQSNNSTKTEQVSPKKTLIYNLTSSFQECKGSYVCSYDAKYAKKTTESFSEQESITDLEESLDNLDVDDVIDCIDPTIDVMEKTFVGIPGSQNHSTVLDKNIQRRRPMNAFMIWAKKFRNLVAREFPDATNSEISVKLGEIWNKLSSDQQRPYYMEAEQLKKDFVYLPQRYIFDRFESRGNRRKLFIDKDGQVRNKNTRREVSRRKRGKKEEEEAIDELISYASKKSAKKHKESSKNVTRLNDSEDQVLWIPKPVYPKNYTKVMYTDATDNEEDKNELEQEILSYSNEFQVYNTHDENSSTMKMSQFHAEDSDLEDEDERLLRDVMMTMENSEEKSALQHMSSDAVDYFDVTDLDRYFTSSSPPGKEKSMRTRLRAKTSK